MRANIVIGIILLCFSCVSKTDNKETNEIKNDSIQELKELHSDLIQASKKLYFDYLTYDSLLINCKVKPFSTYDTLLIKLGQPDTIIEYKNGEVYIHNPYFLIKYDSIEFEKSESNNTCFYNMTLGESNNVICYKEMKFNKSTTLESINSLFPKSFRVRDTITIGKDRLIAVRFHTSNNRTDTQWIMLFLDDKLKYFHYYSADD